MWDCWARRAERSGVHSCQQSTICGTKQFSQPVTDYVIGCRTEIPHQVNRQEEMARPERFELPTVSIKTLLRDLPLTQKDQGSKAGMLVVIFLLASKLDGSPSPFLSLNGAEKC
jgi:hypothetical protein